MKMMLQLVSPTAGKIMMFGKDHREQMKDTYQKIGSIIETPGFYTNLTGQENLEILARFRKNVSKASVKHALEVVGLDQEKKKPFSDYSLGMKQRLGIAAAIMHEPELLMCDIMERPKKSENSQVSISTDKLQKYFPKSYTPKQI